MIFLPLALDMCCMMRDRRRSVSEHAGGCLRTCCIMNISSYNQLVAYRGSWGVSERAGRISTTGGFRLGIVRANAAGSSVFLYRAISV